jgi:hypothetical protein
MKMVLGESSPSKGETLKVQDKSEQRNTNSSKRDKSKGDKGRSKSIGDKKFYRYCKKGNHLINDCWMLQKRIK